MQQVEVNQECDVFPNLLSINAVTENTENGDSMLTSG